MSSNGIAINVPVIKTKHRKSFIIANILMFNKHYKYHLSL